MRRHCRHATHVRWPVKQHHPKGLTCRCTSPKMVGLVILVMARFLQNKTLEEARPSFHAPKSNTNMNITIAWKVFDEIFE
ncbi:hypothetical protein QYF36_007821 [Acer negundo]|nr:hypothetical protein QYF36_007821 [Acer negundo]